MIFEVFRQEKKGQAFAHAGSAHSRAAGRATRLVLGGPNENRPLHTIGCSGRLTTVTLPILTRSRPRLSCVRFRLTYEDAAAGIFR